MIMMKALNSLLRPYSLEQFLSENWAKRGVMISADHPDKFRDLFSWQKLNHLLNFHELEQLHFILNGEILPHSSREDWVKRCKEGATLRISYVHEHVPALADMAWALHQETGHSATHANIYCSWPSQQGSKCHFDCHEVFVLQIDGQKEWFVFEDTFKYPLRGERSDQLTPPDSPPYIHSVLKPGDCLYIPRGHWHYAVALGAPSLHVTLGIRCFTGRDVLDWLSKTMLGTLREQEVWRENLPLIPHGDTQAFEAHVEHLFDSLWPWLHAEKGSFPERVAACQMHTADSKTEISLPGQIGFNLFERGLDTRLRQPKFQPVRLEPLDEANYLLITPQKKVKFKGLEPEVINVLVNRVLIQASFTIREVVHWLPNSDLEIHILPLLAGLVKEGFLVEDNTDPAYSEDSCQDIASKEVIPKAIALQSS